MEALQKSTSQEPLRQIFDAAVAKFIASGAEFILACCDTGQKIPEDSDFWTDAKKNTFLADVKDITAYRFAAKLLEARKYGLEKYGRQSESDSVTATALDGFTAAVDMATALSPIEAFGLNAFINGDLAEDVVPGEEDADFGGDDDGDRGEEEGDIEMEDDDETSAVPSTSYSAATEPFNPANAIAEAVQRLSMSGDWWTQGMDAMEDVEFEMEYEGDGPQESLDLPEDVDILSDSETDTRSPF